MGSARLTLGSFLAPPFGWFFLAALIYLNPMATVLRAQEDPPHFKEVRPTDTRFIAAPLPNNDVCYHESSAPLIYDVEITRAVGVDGIGPTVDSEGKLTNPEAMVSNGILGRDATLRIQVWDQDYCIAAGGVCIAPSIFQWSSLADEVFVNDHRVGTLKSKRGTNLQGETFDQSFTVPIEHLKFGRLSGTKGQAPIKGINKVKIVLNRSAIPSTESGDPAVGPEIRGCEIGPVSIQINAMAPIFFVHGRTSSPDWFEKDPEFGPWLPFVTEFKNRRMPYKSVGSTAMGRTSIPDGAKLLTSYIQEAAIEFGAKHYHLVAHSKGGLWSRSFIGNLIPEGHAVFSLTTLDTPHHGSVLADWSLIAHKHPNLVGLMWPELLAAASQEWDEAIRDLTTGAVGDFNLDPRTEQVRTKPFEVDGEINSIAYRAHAADANVNGNTVPLLGWGIIDCPEECFGYPNVQGPSLYWMQQTHKLAYVRDDGVLVSLLYFLPPFPLNDFAVTVDSARYPGFENPAPVWLKNHTTVGQPDVAEYIRNSLGLALEGVLRGCSTLPC